MTTALTKIDYHKCNGCKRCYELCPVDIYAWDKERDV
ncbi:MAG: ferredoxin family protein, partial [Promethearchaeota archaeon]